MRSLCNAHMIKRFRPHSYCLCSAVLCDIHVPYQECSLKSTLSHSQRDKTKDKPLMSHYNASSAVKTVRREVEQKQNRIKKNGKQIN